MSKWEWEEDGRTLKKERGDKKWRCDKSDLLSDVKMSMQFAEVTDMEGYLLALMGVEWCSVEVLLVFVCMD